MNSCQGNPKNSTDQSLLIFLVVTELNFKISNTRIIEKFNGFMVVDNFGFENQAYKSFLKLFNGDLSVARFYACPLSLDGYFLKTNLLTYFFTAEISEDQNIFLELLNGISFICYKLSNLMARNEQKSVNERTPAIIGRNIGIV